MRRIRPILDFRKGLNQKSFKTLANPPTTEPLFPNFRMLRGGYAKKYMSLLHIPLPPLIFLSVEPNDSQQFQNSIELFPKFSPNIRALLISAYQPEATPIQSEPSYIYRWQNLQSVICPELAFGADVILRFSCMSALTYLEFSLNAVLPPSDPPLFFAHLVRLVLNSESLRPISRLLSHCRLPAITYLSALIDSCPSRQELSSFLDGIRTSGALQRLRVDSIIPVFEYHSSFRCSPTCW